MKRTSKNRYSHLTSSDRIIIEKGLESNESFSSIAKKVGKHPSTISKEVRKHIIYHVKRDMNKAIPCANRKYCRIRSLCGDKTCTKMCKGCYRLDIKCTDLCPNYTPRVCFKLLKAPYVCNGCIKKGGCLMKKSFYSAKHADECYRDLLVSSREGINQSPVDMEMLDQLISPLLKNGQSIAHIYAHHGHEIPCCRRTLYNYIDKSLFAARNIDMRRRVRYKVRKQPTRISLEAKTFRVGRTYENFQKLMKTSPDISVVEMDTVVGGKGTGSSVLLTMLFRNCSLMLIFLIKSKTAEAVIQVFDWISATLGNDLFNDLFPVILTDNGTEFQRPERLEYDIHGEMRTSVYYCNPHSSWQKGMLEKNHEYIRLVIPKGYSLEPYSNDQITLLMNHINSEARDRLNGCTPYNLSKLLLNNKLHDILGLIEIAPDDVMLKPKLLK